MEQSGTSVEAGLAWEELLGRNNWEGLLDPLNLHLRQLILRCGDFSEATYDAFISDVNSKSAGSSRYGKKGFFDKVMLDSAADYQVESFLYATTDGVMPKSAFVISLAVEPWDKMSNFMGYIATTTDEVSRQLGRREIYVVWRGTVTIPEWKNELWYSCPKSAKELLSPNDEHAVRGCCCWGWGWGWGCGWDWGCCCCCSSKVKVMGGWLRIYLSSKPDSPFAKYSARSQLHKKIKELRERYRNESLSIIVTGHSLGASLSVLSAFDLVENEVTDIPVTAIVFACPKVGNKGFNKRVESLPNLKILHIKNKHDWVPSVPPFFCGYVDIGTTMEIDNELPKYLKKPGLNMSLTHDLEVLAVRHNLEAMLNVIAGWNWTKGSTFQPDVITRSRALVNKSSDILIDSESIPGSWWVEKNKGMLRGEDGKWFCPSPSEDDKPVPEFDEDDKPH